MRNKHEHVLKEMQCYTAAGLNMYTDNFAVSSSWSHVSSSWSDVSSFHHLFHHSFLEEFTAMQHQSEQDQRSTARGNNFLVSVCRVSEMQFLCKSQTTELENSSSCSFQLVTTTCRMGFNAS